jgi:hypothetical protein
MSRRKPLADARFGSDAFLDVMSNIVGILVILVVLAGVQLGRQPLARLAGSPPRDETLDEAPPAASTPLAQKVATPAPVEPPPAPATSPAPALVDAVEALTRLTMELSQQRAGNASLLEQSVAQHNATLAQLKEGRRLLTDQAAAVERRKTQIAELESNLSQKRSRLSGLLAEFEEAHGARRAAVEIKHRITPISQEVTGEELHFRLKNSQVTAIPLKLLIERVKQQVERHREVAVMRGGYKGVVGPLDGYSLEFLVEARRLSAIEERRLGFQEGYSLDLSRCTVLPSPSLAGETAEEALRRNSRFATALRAAPEGAAVTFWTYPDSFGLFRKLQEACHAEGFIVAGRPLPEGAPIVGDRRGTRSAGQ